MVGVLLGCGGGSSVQNQSSSKTSVVLTASDNTTYRGDTIWLAWVAANATSVTGSDFNAGNVSGYLYVNPQASRTYSVSVNGPGGPATSKVSIKVAPGPSHIIQMDPICLDPSGASFELTGDAFGLNIGRVTFQAAGKSEQDCMASPDPTYGVEGVDFGFNTNFADLSSGIVLRVREAGSDKLLYETNINSVRPITVAYNYHTFTVSPVSYSDAASVTGTATGPTVKSCYWHNESTGAETAADVSTISGGIRFQYKPSSNDLTSQQYTVRFKSASGDEIASLPVALNPVGTGPVKQRPRRSIPFRMPPPPPPK